MISVTNCVMISTWMTACSIIPWSFKAHPTICGCLTDLRNKPRKSRPTSYWQWHTQIVMVYWYSYWVWWKVCLTTLCVEDESISILYCLLPSTIFKQILQWSIDIKSLSSTINVIKLMTTSSHTDIHIHDFIKCLNWSCNPHIH